MRFAPPTTAEASTLAAAIIALTASAGIAAGVTWLIDPQPPAGLDAFIAGTRFNATEFRPEPREMLVYLIALACLPVMLIGLQSRLVLPGPYLGVAWLSGLVGILLSIFLATPASWDRTLYAVFGETEFLSPLGWPIILVLALCAAIARWPILARTVTPLCLLLVTLVFSMSQVTENDSLALSGHFNILTAPLVDVLSGRTLLVDQPAQYGLWPHLAEPLFRLTGTSVTGVALLFNSLTAISLMLIMRYLQRTVTHVVLQLLGFVSLLSVCLLLGRYLTLDDTGIVDPYYQFWSIRLLFPALLLYALTLLGPDLSPGRLAGWTLAFSIGIFWNLDTGLPVFVTWSALLLYTAPDRASAMRRGACCLIALAAVSATILGYLTLRAGAPPRIENLVAIQQLFAGYGFYMLPMPLIHPWHVVALIYTLALAVALRRPGAEPHALGLALLGFGLAPYFVGRSHELTFLMILFPAILLVVQFADRSVSALRAADLNHYHAITLLCAVALLTGSTASAFVKLPAFTEVTLHRVALAARDRFPYTQAVIDLVGAAVPGEKPSVLFLTHHSSFWHLVTNTRSPVSDEYQSFFHRREYESLYAAITSRQHAVLVEHNYASDGETGRSEERFALLAALRASGFEKVARLSDDTFSVWRPVTAAPRGPAVRPATGRVRPGDE